RAPARRSRAGFQPSRTQTCCSVAESQVSAVWPGHAPGRCSSVAYYSSPRHSLGRHLKLRTTVSSDLHRALQLIQQREPVVQRLPFWRKGWIEENFLGSNLGAGGDIVADLLERSGEDRPVIAKRLGSEIQTCMHDHFHRGWIAPRFFSHLPDAGKHVRHDGYRKENRIPPVSERRKAFQRLGDKSSQINWRM